MNTRTLLDQRFWKRCALACIVTVITHVSELVIPVDADARVRVSERNTFYAVRGKDGPSIFREIVRKGARANGSRHAIASAHMRLQISNVQMKSVGNRCRVHKYKMQLRIKYVYPKWRVARRASKAVKSKWAVFYRELQRHEKTHGRIARQHATALEKEIKKASSRTTRRCHLLDRKLAKLVRNYEKRHERAQNQFDRRDARRSSRISKARIGLVMSK
ncbi:MAG: DUF922 domain-containing protein [Pseudomonadota bacterium]